MLLVVLFLVLAQRSFAASLMVHRQQLPEMPRSEEEAKGRGAVITASATTTTTLVEAGTIESVAIQSEEPVAKRSSLNREFLGIMGPALLGLTIDPVASLVDTAFIGRTCGEAALAGVGVATSVFNVLAKSCNFLQSATTSHVARAGSSSHLRAGQFDASMARVASAAEYVAVAAGVVITLALRSSGLACVRALGVSDDVEVSTAAVEYLGARALAAPAALSLMALQGAFRGARDASSPVAALALATLANVGLDSLLVPVLGARGAAHATTISQVVAAGTLVAILARRTGECAGTRVAGLVRPRADDCVLIAKSGSVLALRTLSGVAAMQYASVIAAKLGAEIGAAHVIAYQLWLATSLLADAVAVACQALLAEALAATDRPRARAILAKATVVAIACSIGNAWVLSHGDALCSFFTRDPATLAAAASIWPIVVRSQAFCCAAFVADGFLFAACDFSYCAVAMCSASLISLVVQLALAPRLGLPGVWLGLELLMGLRFATGAGRVLSRTGPWAHAFTDPRWGKTRLRPPPTTTTSLCVRA